MTQAQLDLQTIDLQTQLEHISFWSHHTTSF